MQRNSAEGSLWQRPLPQLKAVRLAQDQYKVGLVDFSNVLDAQRSLLSFQDQLAQSNGAVTSNLIRLYKALGGGWTCTEAGAVTSNTVTH